MNSETLVILDLDGTILDLGLYSERTRQRLVALLREVGITSTLTPITAELEQHLNELASRDPSLASEIRLKAWEIMTSEELSVASTSRILRGTRKFFDRFPNLPLALYTNNDGRAAETALRSVGIDPSRFFRIEARSEPRSLKPSPEPIAGIIRAAGIENPGRIFMIGDHVFDIESARAAHVTPIGIYRNDRHRERMDQVRAPILIRDLGEAIPFVEQQAVPFSLSPVVLAFNEERNIARAVEDLRDVLGLYAPNYEIVVVNDGSTDRTAAELDRIAGPDLRVVTHATNLGMGASMHDGYRAVRTEFAFHLPGDRQVRAQSIVDFLPYIERHAVVRSTYAHAPSGLSRWILSIMFRFLLRAIAKLHVNFAGTYVFHRDEFQRTNPETMTSRSFIYSFELLQRFRLLGLEMKQVVISPFPRTDGASREISLRRIRNVWKELWNVRGRRNSD